MSNQIVRSVINKSIPIGLIVVSIVMALLFSELIVRLVVNPGDFLIASLIDDKILGFRIKPNTTDHDELGFRNEVAPKSVDIVAIGDSQTYGVSAPRNGSWPYQLGELLHQPVYNMALGGYGPLQYLYLAQHEAKKLSPKVLLVGFYFGNDLMDAYSLAHNTAYWSNWREGSSAQNDKPQELQSSNAEPIKRFGNLRDWLSRHSVLYSMLRVTLFSRLAAWEQDRIALQAEPNQQMLWIDPSSQSVRTIFTPQSRFDAMDTRHPMVQEGLKITEHAFSSMQKEADSQGTKLIIVLIPTKERVYTSYIKDSGKFIPNVFISLGDAENRIKEELIQFFATNKIEYIDVTKAMEEQTFRHIQIYPKSSDGHPLAAGYSVIAHKIYDSMCRQP